MKHKYVLLLTLLSFVCIKTSLAAGFVSIETRNAVKQNFALLKSTSSAVASVILVPGGNGIIKLHNNNGEAIIKRNGNFLVRTRDAFAGQGFNVAVLDAPSDHYDNDGMFYGFRNSDEHMADIKKVAEYLKLKFNLPVWVVGTSRGTESTANAATKITGQLKGIVLTSSITQDSKKGTALTEMALNRITLPVLIVAHTDDACWVTPPADAEKLKSALTNAAAVEVKMFSGGDEPVSGPCQAKSAHGYLGIEQNVVKYIATFIKKYSL